MNTIKYFPEKSQWSQCCPYPPYPPLRTQRGCSWTQQPRVPQKNVVLGHLLWPVSLSALLLDRWASAEKDAQQHFALWKISVLILSYYWGTWGDINYLCLWHFHYSCQRLKVPGCNESGNPYFFRTKPWDKVALLSHIGCRACFMSMML